jgi:hypothetical protein
MIERVARLLVVSNQQGPLETSNNGNGHCVLCGTTRGVLFADIHVQDDARRGFFYNHNNAPKKDNTTETKANKQRRIMRTLPYISSRCSVFCSVVQFRAGWYRELPSVITTITKPYCYCNYGNYKTALFLRDLTLL